MHRSKQALLFDHLVGAWEYFEAEPISHSRHNATMRVVSPAS
jgi:hypothetical protein